VTRIPIIGLLLLALAQPGIDKQLVRGWRRLADVLLRWRNDNITSPPVSVIDFVGVVVRRTSHPDRRVIRGEDGSKKPDRRENDGIVWTVWTVPNASGEIVSAATMGHPMGVAGQSSECPAMDRIAAVMGIARIPKLPMATALNRLRGVPGRSSECLAAGVIAPPAISRLGGQFPTEQQNSRQQGDHQAQYQTFLLAGKVYHDKIPP